GPDTRLGEGGIYARRRRCRAAHPERGRGTDRRRQGGGGGATASLAIVRERDRDVGANHHDDGAVQAVKECQRAPATTPRPPADTSPASGGRRRPGSGDPKRTPRGKRGAASRTVGTYHAWALIHDGGVAGHLFMVGSILVSAV